MKTMKNIMTIALLSTVALGGTVTLAESNTYDAVDSEATINFVKSLEEEEVEIPGMPDPEVIDPEDPEIVDPTHPENPNPNPNPSNNLLRINYVSDFDFGTWGSTSNAIKAYAKAQPIYLTNGKVKDVAPFISTIDNRGTERGEGWTLSATASVLTDEKDNELKGAQIILSNGHYTGGELAPKGFSENKNISEGKQTLADTTADTGAGQWSMALGNVKEFTTQLPTKDDASILEDVTYKITDGVRIEIPRNTVTNNTEYSGTITWELETSV
ncbi:WxL domain-containing protein [Vagococcus xieshaowenii]|uniref:WxL domain-containing protein n=1 Tax=Vagococcus xieshaowenii TaxID=2562451 RepID=A0AAJ5JQS0_9ENTE|nr:WxL domain-containing protein [Vagococcus xieshaowenii]QCA28172.1 WxL domain-containing protein [Vagococcus xieshaowenii]TFZ42525.1 WxL domain-containing protein [Vagococcus xieshaowenii]